uniref:Retrotransposon gag domain-containing protein n=1 Tax=Cajanus cajan TaxID=3821 RepID=A0A151UDR9_CAJCA
MKMCLKSKNKLQFIDESLPKPANDDSKFLAWDRCNTLVLSWILHSLDSSIAQSVLWMDNAAEVWNDLRDRYYQGDDAFRICELQEEIYLHKQGNSSITTYFTHLKGLWQELNNFRPIPSCTCKVPCSCQLIPTVVSYRENDYVIRFLKGLNDQYSTVRSQIMLMEPLPKINKVFSLLIQQERQMSVQPDITQILMNNTESYVGGRGDFGRGRRRGRNHNFSGQGYKGHGKNNKMCTYCNKFWPYY